ncbi:hypothetical protein ROS9278_01144 [Roseomonas sp. CECT 9278]|nr:hypothetical protein ROS9278_01144 [Roseomonas sp. CECT 9278]
MRVTEAALATSIPPAMRRPGPGGVEAGPAWRAACAASWPSSGWRVMTVNPAAECDRLGELPAGIEAVTAQPGVAETYGRPGAWIADALACAVATGAPVVGLVNADILLSLDGGARAALVERAAQGMVACNRTDVLHGHQGEGTVYRYGYDLVMMPRDMAVRLDLSGFAFGVPWWDYWIVLDAMLQGLPVMAVQCEGIRHLSHAQAWDRPGWRHALGVLMRHLAPRRDALSRLAPGPVAEAMADLLLAVAPEGESGYPIDDLMVISGTRFGIEVVRMAERDAWRLEMR